MKIAKAVAATLAPLALPILHAAGLTEVSLGGLEQALLMVYSGAVTYFVPNKSA